jgi:hypothetical protein
MKIRNKTTGQIFEVVAGTLYAKNIFEEVTDDEIKVGEPTVEFEIEEQKEESKPEPKPKNKPAKKAKKTKKGAKKNGNSTK